MDKIKTSKSSRLATQVTLIYLTFGILWVTLSYFIAGNMNGTIEDLIQLDTLKGALFILLSSAMVFILVRKQTFKQQQIEQKLSEREQQFKQSSRELQMIIDNIPSYIIYKNDRNIILRVNKYTADAAGTTTEAMAGKHAGTFYPEYAEKYYQDDLEVIRSGQSKLGIIEQISTSDGSHQWIESSKIPIHKRTGKLTEILVIATDITERKLAEDKQLQQQALLEAIFNDIPDALMMADLKRKIILANPGTSRIFGYDTEKLIGKSTEIFYRNKDEYNQQGEQRFNSNAQVTLSPYTINYQRKNGEIFPGESIGTIIKDRNEQPIGYLCLVRDVTDRMAMEQETRDLLERLAHVNRLSTMSEMTAGIAHEINQPLTAITNYAQASRRLLELDPASPKLAEALQKISNQALRAGDIIRKLRDFIKQRESRHELIDSNEIIRKVVQIAEVDTCVNNIPIVLQLGENIPTVSVDPVQIQQVILNLVRNGMDAILIAKPQQPKIVITSSLVNDNEILISVDDNGTGISDNIVENIFSPFVSTKSTGMGMGLSISSTIIGAHGSELHYKPLTTGGSQFYFTLPVVTGE